MNALLSIVMLAAVTPSPAAKANFDRGEKALEAQQFDVAVSAYKEALTATPGWAPALNGMGSALFKQGKKAEAIAQFKAATDADPAFKLAWFNLGYSSRKTQDFKTAAMAYEKYTQLDPTDPDGFYGLGESYRQHGDSAKAIAAYEEYLKKEKRPTEQKWIDKAKEFLTQLRAAAPAAHAAAQPAPTQPPPAQPAPTQPAPQVQAPAPVAKPPEPSRPSQAPPQPPATATAPPATSPAPSGPGAHPAARGIAEGDKLSQDKKFREASFAFADAVRADPSNFEARFKLGNTYAALGYFPQAIDQWNAAAQLTSDARVKKSAQDNIAKAQQKMANASAGAAPTAPGTPSPRVQARAFYEQGVKQVSERDFGKALASFSSAVQLEPTLAVGYVARGSALIGLKRYQEAAVDYQYALKLDPNMASPLYGLAEAYTGLNQRDDAKVYYERYAASTANDARPDLQTLARSKVEQMR